MKINYIVPYGSYDGSECTLSGIQNKINSQIACLEKLGCDITRNDLVLSLKSPIGYIKSLFQVKSKFESILNTTGSGDVIYIRNIFPYTVYYSLIKMQHKQKIVFEIQDIARTTSKIKLSYTLFKNFQNLSLTILDILFGKKIIAKSDGVVAVTKEIGNYYYNTSKNKPVILTLGNGINTDSYQLKRLVEYDKHELHVIMVAGVCFWHGVDRFIRGMHEYTGDTSIILHVVGDGPALSDLRSLTDELNLKNNVIFHGFKSGKDLDDMFDISHIALDALAGFRKGLTESSSLKSREYCARGIPFIRTDKDPDISEKWEYIQMVPADESPIDMNTVISFADKVLADPEHPQKMRKFAEERLDWLAKMKVLKEFLETL